MTIQDLIDKLIDEDYSKDNYLCEQENFDNHIISTIYDYFKNELKDLDISHIGFLSDLELSHEILKLKNKQSSKIESYSILSSCNSLYVVIKFFNPALPTIRVETSKDVINDKIKLKKLLNDISTSINS